MGGKAVVDYHCPVKRSTPLLIAAVAATLYLPFVPSWLTGWDPIQFALGLEGFDLAAHAPHPPGYLGHLGLAWILSALGLGPGGGVIGASLVAAAAGAGAVWALGRRLHGEAAAWAAAALYVTHPLVWSQALSGESYAAEALVATLLVWAGLGVGPGASRLRLWGFFALYGLSGGLRQSLPLFFLPYAAWRLWEARGTTLRESALRVTGAGLAGAAGILCWLVPLAILAGGLDALAAAFGRQFFQIFGRAYSPLLGANRAAVASNLDGLWRFLVVALSVGGGAALVLWPLTRKAPVTAPVPARERYWLNALWALPPLLWFGLMFVYKAGHVLVLVPLLTLLAGNVMARTGGLAALSPSAPGAPPRSAMRGWTTALVAAVCVGQAALFLAPPSGWVRAFGDTGLPAYWHADLETEATVGALRDLSGGDPDGVLVVTRDARFTFRRAMWHLPDLRVLWLVDADSTGVPMRGVEVCEARQHAVRCASGAGFWQWGDRPHDAEVRLAPTTRTIAWFADPAGPFARALRTGPGVKALVPRKPFEVWVTDVPPGPVDLRVGAYRFFRE